jgi:hypothetical protein
MSALPRVSLIVVCFDYGRFLAECLDSALAQPYPNLEVILVDDGSTDETPQVAAAYGDRIRSIRKANGGVASAVNAGMEAATGELIALVSADDTLCPDRFGAQVAHLLAHPETGLVYSDMEVVDGDGNLLHPSWFGLMGAESPSGDLLERLMLGNVVSGGALLVRASLRHRWHPIPEFMRAEDWYIAFQVACVAGIDFVPVPAIRYRKHGSNMNFGNANRAENGVDELLVRRAIAASRDTGRASFGHVAANAAVLRDVPEELRLRALDRDPRDWRGAARARHAEAAALLEERRFDAAARTLVQAYGLDPTSDEPLRLASFAADLAQRRRDGIAGAAMRGFRAVADADELLADEPLLRSYLDSFAAEDDAMLIVRVATREQLDALAARLGASGSDAYVLAADEEDRTLAAVGDALLGRAAAGGELGLLPRFESGLELRAFASRRR